jgi:hypothetical protein
VSGHSDPDAETERTAIAVRAAGDALERKEISGMSLLIVSLLGSTAFVLGWYRGSMPR